MDWKTYKGEGPWPFAQQPNKWGYLNNPRWVPAQTAPVNYDSNPEDEPQVWTPEGNNIRGSDKHFPCGHWHKVGNTPEPRFFDLLELEYYQQSVDVYKGRIALCGMSNDGDDGYLVCAIREVNGQWYALGAVENISQFSEPSTLRITDDWVFYYTVHYLWNDPGTWYSYASLWRFGHQDYPRQTVVWLGDVSGTPYMLDDYEIKDKMDAYGSRVACIAHIIEEGGVVNKRWQVKVSDDYGQTFSKTYDFPAASTNESDVAFLRMSEDGRVWVAYARLPSVGNHTIELWRSNSTATSFTKVLDRDITVDMGGSFRISFHFDCLESDGEKCTLRIRYFSDPISPGTFDNIIYEVSNYGSSVDMHHSSRNFPPSPYRNGWVMSSDGQHYVTPFADGFEVSADGGDTINQVNPTVADFLYQYPDIQKYHNQIAYTECGMDFNPEYLDREFLSILYSEDYGQSWEVIHSPIPCWTASPGLIDPMELDPTYTDEIIDVPGGTTINIIPIVGPTYTWNTAPTLDWAHRARWVRIL
jgi:hypothetical protein